MAVNGAVKQPTPAQLRALTGPPLSSTFDVYERMFASFDMGTVFDYGQADARDLREMLRRDGNARKIEQVLTLPLRSASWEIRPAPGGDREATYIKNLFTDKLDAIIAGMTSAVIYRKAFFELAWTVDGSGTVGIDQVAYRPATSCEAGYDPHTGDHKGFRQRVGNPGGILIVPGRPQKGDLPGYVTIPAERAFVYTHGVHREPITGLSDFEVASWAYQTKQKVLFLWCQFLEQQSTPKIVAYGDDRTQADANRDALADAQASAVIGWERGSDPSAKMFDVLSTDGAGATQFLQMISYLDSQMSSSVLAGFTDLTALASHTRSQGSYALSADQSEFFLSARQAVADEMATQIDEQLFARACLYQFGADAKPPSLTIGPLNKHDKERSMRVLESLITAPQFNVPPGFVDLLINSTAGYLGLPVDKVAELVMQHPTQDPALVKAQAAGISSGALGPDGQPVSPDTVAPVTPPNPPVEGDAGAVWHAGDTPAARVARVERGQPARDAMAEMSQVAMATSATHRYRHGWIPIDGETATPKTPPLHQLKAQADKLGPNSKAAAAYKAALNQHAANIPGKAPGKAPAKKVTLADLAKSLPSKKKAAPPAAKAAPAPVKAKPAPVSAEHKKNSLTGLSRDQLDALKRYTGDDYRGINGGLRKQPPGTKYSKVVSHIDSALAAKPLPAPTKVWRTVSSGAFNLGAHGDASALKGKVFTEAGFMSTSVKNQRFPVTPPPVHLTIEVPPGVGAAYLEPITQNSTENELLLQRNLRYVITGVRYSSAKGGWTATARVLPGSVAE